MNHEMVCSTFQSYSCVVVIMFVQINNASKSPSQHRHRYFLLESKLKKKSVYVCTLQKRALMFISCHKITSIHNEKLQLVSWCFELSQPQRITSGLKTDFSLSPSYSFNKVQSISITFYNTPNAFHNNDKLQAMTF